MHLFFPLFLVALLFVSTNTHGQSDSLTDTSTDISAEGAQSLTDSTAPVMESIEDGDIVESDTVAPGEKTEIPDTLLPEESSHRSSNDSLEKPEEADRVETEAPSESETDAILSILEEEDIQLEEGEESLFEEEPVSRTVVVEEDTLAETSLPDTGSVAESNVPGRPPANRPPSRRMPPSMSKGPPPGVRGPGSTEPRGPASIEQIESINFARNLEGYRSPQLAMLLSLLVPGTGQAYAHNYLKSAIFGVVEASIIGVSVALHVKGREEEKQAREFADRHYDPEKFAAYYDSLYAYFLGRNSDLANPDSAAEEWITSIYWTDSLEDYVETFLDEAGHSSNTFYDLIKSNSHVQGWDDCEPTLQQMLDAGLDGRIEGERDVYYTHPIDADSLYLVDTHAPADGAETLKSPRYGYSDNQDQFRSMVSSANKYYRNGLNMLFVLLVNHVASAIDAGITAKRYNDMLLGKKNTFWQRIDLEQQWVDSGNDIATGIALKVGF